jgi:hypothetical protein
MYLLGEAGGWLAQDALWSLLEHGDVEIAELSPELRTRMRVLMDKYQDRPMDLADASLVVLAEKRGLRDVFTLDHADFKTALQKQSRFQLPSSAQTSTHPATVSARASAGPRRGRTPTPSGGSPL